MNKQIPIIIPAYEPDEKMITLLEKLKQAKFEGEKQRTKNDLFYLALAIAIREGKANIDSVKKVLHNAFARRHGQAPTACPPWAQFVEYPGSKNKCNRFVLNAKRFPD